MRSGWCALPECFQFANTNLTLQISETAHFAQANYLLLFDLAASALLIDHFFPSLQGVQFISANSMRFQSSSSSHVSDRIPIFSRTSALD